LGFLLFFLALPLSKGLTSVAVGVLVGTAVFRSFKNHTFPFPRYWLLPIALFILLLISISYSESYREGWNVLYRQNMLIFLPFAFWIHTDVCRAFFHRGMQIFVGACTLAAGVTLLFVVLPTAFSLQLAETLSFLQDYIVHEKEYAFGSYSPFIDRLQFSYLLGISLFLHVYLFLKFNWKWWIGVSFLVQLTALLILGARGAQLAFLVSSGVGIIFYFYQFRNKKSDSHKGKWETKWSSIVVIGVLVASPFLAYKTIPAVQVRYDQLRWEIGTLQDGTYVNYAYEHFTSLRRIVSWQATWQTIQEQPLLGVGIGDHKLALQQQYKNRKFDIPINSHQQFLYYWVVGGIGAALVFLVAYLIFIRKALQTKSPWKRLFLLSFIIFYGFVFCLDSPLMYQTGGLAFWSFYLLFIPFLNTAINDAKSRL
jgi:O-antigen ligase